MNTRLLDVNNMIQLVLKRADFKYESLESFKESPISSNETLDFSTSMFAKYSGTEEESPDYTRYAEEMRNSINDLYEKYMMVDGDEKNVCFKEIYNLTMRMSELLRRAEKDAAIALEKSKSVDSDKTVEMETRVRDMRRGKRRKSKSSRKTCTSESEMIKLTEKSTISDKRRFEDTNEALNKAFDRINMLERTNREQENEKNQL